MSRRFCNRCLEEKNIQDFHKKGIDYFNICKICRNLHNKQYYSLNKEKILSKINLYKKQNKEKISLKAKEYYLEKGKLKNQSRKKEIYTANEKYRNSHKVQINKITNKRNTLRKKNDLGYKLKCLLRDRFNKALKNNAKFGSAIKDLGCSIPELKQWLESQFKEGMTWENHGEWHIDHIIPLCKFDLSDPKQVKKACHWFNLQPLWAEENLSKGDRINV